MKDEDKTKEQLINELVEMRQRITELEASETQHRRAEEALRKRGALRSHGELGMNLHSLTQLFTKPLSYKIIFIVLIILIPFNSFAEENADYLQKENLIVIYGSEVDFNSRYVWRGIAYSEGPVMQPSVWVTASGFTFSIWNNFVLTDEANQGDFHHLNEVDLSLSYSRERGKLAIEPSLQFYQYPKQEDSPSTGEASLLLSYPVGSITVFSSHTFDIVRYGGSYFGDAGLSYEHEFHSKLSMETSLSLGLGSSKFNEVYLGLPKSAFNVTSGALSFTYYPINFLYLRPHIELSVIVDGDLRNQVDDPTIVNVGLAVGMEF